MRKTLNLIAVSFFSSAALINAQIPSSFYLPGDGQLNNNGTIGDFCCTGETATVYNDYKEPIGYIYFYDFSDGQIVGSGSIAGTFGVLVSGATDLAYGGSPRLQNAVNFEAYELTSGASRSADAGSLRFTVTILGASLTDDGRYYRMGSVSARVDVNFVEQTPPPSDEIYSQGQMTIRGTWMYDLDLGVETEKGADFWWEQATHIERYIAPQKGATFVVLGKRDFDSITRDDLSRFSYSEASIRGTDANDSQIQVGTVVAAITGEGRFSKFRIDQYGYNLAITWVTYAR